MTDNYAIGNFVTYRRWKSVYSLRKSRELANSGNKCASVQNLHIWSEFTP